MSRSHLSLNVLNVQSPCRVPWRSMSGNDRVRFCGQCRKNVYNLSAMTSSEAESLLRSGHQTPCVRYFRRFDGSVITSDRCGSRIARALRRFTIAFFAPLVALASLAGCDWSGLRFGDQGKIAPPPGAATNPPPANPPAADDADEESE